ncbi:ABC transporter [Microbacterium sp. LRZ72]|uniref:ABC transporter n=1 Tax=Microbacterium sp. LRZ72 TaxID=2942481 RepID=UPI0029B53FA4|nr:ABC transporter [Microbacterium sp. LRZ72]MDX2376644.1 ABC transporter [Microbacterium sp. LRZ72]
MSDPDKAPGEPVDEPQPVDDVVVRANEGLADAEAAQRDISTEGEASRPYADPADSTTPADTRGAAYEPPATAAASADAPETEAATAAGAAPAAYEAPAAHETSRSPAAQAEAPSPSATTYTLPPASAEPAYTGAAAGTTSGIAAADESAAGGPQHIFVQAPEPPRPRGNRAAAGLIGLLAALSFAVLYLAAALVIGLLDRTYTIDTLAEGALSGLQSWWLWVTTILFFLGFWLLGAIINLGRWGHWVIWGLLVGVVAYGAHLVGQLFQAPFWQLTRTQGAELVEAQLVAPLAFVAFVIGRELTIWFGAWISARGRRIREINDEAQREYERTLEAGPQLVRH